MGPELPAGCSCHFLALEEVSEGPDPDVEREVRCTRTDVTRQMKDEGWAGGGDSEGVGVHAGRDASIPWHLQPGDWNLEENRQETGGKA